MKFRDEFYLRAYLVARTGAKNSAIAKALGVSQKQFKVWVENRPALKESITLARNSSDGKNAKTFSDYVYDRLTPKLKRLWEELEELHDDPQSTTKQVERLFQNHGTQSRQRIFLHAVINSNFNYSTALRMANISKRTLDRWLINDPSFGELLDELQWHKANFFEDSLVALVGIKDVDATLFANRTFNRDRGYGDKIQHDVNVSGSVAVNVSVIDVDDLDLPFRVRKEILQAVRAVKSERQKLLDDSSAVDLHKMADGSFAEAS